MVLALPTLGAGIYAVDATRSAHSPGTSKEKPTTMELRLTAKGETVTAASIDNATSKDVLSLFPLTLTIGNYAAKEKIAYLPRKLGTARVPP